MSDGAWEQVDSGNGDVTFVDSSESGGPADFSPGVSAGEIQGVETAGLSREYQPDNGYSQQNAQQNAAPANGGQQNAQPQAKGNDNPAWNPILSPVPQEFHPHLKQYLSQNDRYVQQLQTQFAPYKDVIESGVQPQDIDQALQLAYLFQTNPRGVFDFLNQTHGFGNQQQVQQIGQGQQSGQQEFDISNGQENGQQNAEFDLSKNPQFAAMQQQLALAQQQAQVAAQFAQQQQATQMRQQVDAQVQNEVAQLQQQFPHIPVGEIARRAIANASIDGKPEDMFRAAQEIHQAGWFNGNAAQAQAQRTAPPNLSGGANRPIPSQSANPGKMSSDERARYVAQRLAIANGQGS